MSPACARCLPLRTSKRSQSNNSPSPSHFSTEEPEQTRQTLPPQICWQWQANLCPWAIVILLLQFHLIISHCNCLLLFGNLSFLCTKQIGYFCFLRIPSCGFPSNTSTLENSTFLLHFSFTKQVHSGHTPLPFAIASIMLQLPGFCRVFLITLPWHFRTHEHSKVFHKETLKHFWHPVGSKLFSLLNRSLVLQFHEPLEVVL